MAINPPSDIVLGAVLAADPAKYRAAAERLKRASGDTGSADADFAAAMSELPSWQTSTVPETIAGNGQNRSPMAASASSAPIARSGGATYVLLRVIRILAINGDSMVTERFAPPGMLVGNSVKFPKLIFWGKRRGECTSTPHRERCNTALTKHIVSQLACTDTGVDDRLKSVNDRRRD